MVFGIPFVAILVNTLLFGHLLQDNDTSQFSACIVIALIYTSIYWFFFRLIFMYVGKKYAGVNQNKKRQVITSIYVILGYLFLQFVLDAILHENIHKLVIVQEPNSALKVITSLVFTVLILAVYEGIYLSNQIRQSEVEKSQILRESIDSQLAGLKNQINPHFLFNSLNTLSSLVHEDADRADAFISKLANVYRYLLEKKDDHLVTLKDELNYLHSYVHLMKERFGDNLHYNEKVDALAVSKFILPLSLQITFENCIKHNIITKEKPLYITINTSLDGQSLTISNNLQKIKFPDAKTSVGLDNIKQRYNFFTDRQVIVNEGDGHFTVTLPLLPKDSFKNFIK